MEPPAARELLATAACEVERTRAALAVVETGSCPGVTRLTGDNDLVLSTALRRELVRHVDDCPRCRRTAERAVPGSWPGTSVTPAALPVLEAPRTALHRAMAHVPARGAADRASTGAVSRWSPRTTRPAATASVRVPSPRPSSPPSWRPPCSPCGPPTEARPSPARARTAARSPPTRRTAPTDSAAIARLRERRQRQHPAGPPPHAGRRLAGRLGGGHQRPGPGQQKSGLSVEAGHSGDTTLITLRASGSSRVHWSAHTGASWLYLSQSSGTLEPGESLTIKVYVDHLREPTGPWSASVSVAPAGAVVSIEGYGPAAPSPSHPGPGPSRPTRHRPDPEPTPTASARRSPRPPTRPPIRRTRRPRSRPHRPVTVRPGARPRPVERATRDAAVVVGWSRPAAAAKPRGPWPPTFARTAAPRPGPPDAGPAAAAATPAAPRTARPGGRSPPCPSARSAPAGRRRTRGRPRRAPRSPTCTTSAGRARPAPSRAGRTHRSTPAARACRRAGRSTRTSAGPAAASRRPAWSPGARGPP